MTRRYYIAKPINKPLPPVVCSFDLSYPLEPSLPGYEFSESFASKNLAERALSDLKRKARAKRFQDMVKK